MIQKISEPVSVNFNLSPKLVTWRGRSYEITQVGLHHTYREGRVLYHVFSVVSGSFYASGFKYRNAPLETGGNTRWTLTSPLPIFYTWI